MALLLLKPLNLSANYVLNGIIYITNPRNNIGLLIMPPNLEKKIKGFPTWEINGKLILGVLSLKELSNLTGFKN